IPEFPVLLAELETAKEAAKNARSYMLPQLFEEQAPQRVNHETSLQQTQSHMQEAIMLGNNFDSNPDAWVRAKESFAPAEQLAVYSNAYRYRLYDITAEDYPVLKHFLGEDAFHGLIWAFVNHAQPVHFNIARYTLKLPDFVKSYLPED